MPDLKQPPLENNDLFALDSAELAKRMRDYILEYLNNYEHQPGAGEMLAKLQDKFGWQVRQLFVSVVQELCQDKSLKRYQRDYLNSNLNQEDIEKALRGKLKPSDDFKSSIDDLIKKSILYRSSFAFQEAITFIAKFRAYAPFNNLLVKLQNPACGFYATEKDWHNNFNRKIKKDARPMIILAPMHPVMLVYDLDSTEGPPLPQHFEEFGHTQAGEKRDNAILEKTLENTPRDLIGVEFNPLSTTLAGFVTTRVYDRKYKMRIVIDDNKNDASRYSVLCHELAHIYLGHLGGDPDKWWPSRINLPHAAVEIEAEAVAYTVAIRTGLKPASESYISSYLTNDSLPDSVSLELIAKVAGRIEEMGRRKLPTRKRLKSSSPPMDDELLLL